MGLAVFSQSIMYRRLSHLNALWPYWLYTCCFRQPKLINKAPLIIYNTSGTEKRFPSSGPTLRTSPRVWRIFLFTNFIQILDVTWSNKLVFRHVQVNYITWGNLGFFPLHIFKWYDRPTSSAFWILLGYVSEIDHIVLTVIPWNSPRCRQNLSLCCENPAE